MRRFFAGRLNSQNRHGFLKWLENFHFLHKIQIGFRINVSVKIQVVELVNCLFLESYEFGIFRPNVLNVKTLLRNLLFEKFSTRTEITFKNCVWWWFVHSYWQVTVSVLFWKGNHFCQRINLGFVFGCLHKALIQGNLLLNYVFSVWMPVNILNFRLAISP